MGFGVGFVDVVVAVYEGGFVEVLAEEVAGSGALDVVDVEGVAAGFEGLASLGCITWALQHFERYMVSWRLGNFQLKSSGCSVIVSYGNETIQFRTGQNIIKNTFYNIQCT